MRVLQVTPHYHPGRGGVERHVQAISERLVRLGHKVEVATLAPNWRASTAVINGVGVRRFPSVGPGRAYQLPLGMFSYLTRSVGGFDVAHVHNYHGGLTPMVAAARPAPRLVITPHLNERPHSRVAQVLHWPFAPLGSWSLHQADAIVCVSAAERERLARRFGVPRGRTRVISNGADGVLAGARRPRDPHLLLVVARLEAYKRVDRAIQSLELLPSTYRLVVIGEGPLRPWLERETIRRRLTARVRFVGRVSDAELADWYARAGALLALSSAEAFGLSVVEAVAAGCPALCSPIPAFQELAHRCPGGVQIVAADDPAAVAAAVQAASRQATDALRFDLADLSWDAVTGQLVELYAEVTREVGQCAS